MEIVDTIGISITAFFMLFVLQKREKQSSDYALVLLALIIVLHLGVDIWIRYDFNQLNFIISTVLPFTIFPLYLVYGLLLIDPEQKLRRRWAWLGSMALAYGSFVVIDHLLLTSYDEAGLRTLFFDPPPIYLFFLKGYDVFNLCAILWFFRRLKDYQKRIENNYSFIEPIRLNWLKTMSWVFFSVNIVATVVFVLYNIGWIKNIDWSYGILHSFVALVMAFMGFKGIRTYTEVELYGRQEKMGQGKGKELEKEVNPVESKVQPVPPAPKYQSSSLAPDQMDELFQSLVELFEAQKLYTEPRLQVRELAERLGVTPQRISQTINSKTGKRFYDYVNTYRVEHLKKLLHDPSQSHLTILALGLDSGFNSKASLNRIFKQFTGQSPREFQQQEPVTS